MSNVSDGFDRTITVKLEGSPFNPDWPLLCPMCGGGVKSLSGATLPTLEAIFSCGSKYWLSEKQLMTVHAGAPCAECGDYIGLGERHECTGKEG